MPRVLLKKVKQLKSAPVEESDEGSASEMEFESDDESVGSEMESFDEDDGDDESENEVGAAGAGDDSDKIEISDGDDEPAGNGQIESASDDDADDEALRMLDLDDDEELQLAFAKGILKPGLNAIGVDQRKTYTNDKPGLLSKLKSFQLNLPWIEMLQLTVKPAPMAPELALEEQEHAGKRLKMFEARMAKKASKGQRKAAAPKGIEADAVHNDFKREVGFYRLAQAAVLEGIPRLKKEGAKTKKPQDYFAEMSKTDDHMQRVRHKLLDEERRAEESAKARRLRELKKFGKQTQVAVLQRRNEEKRQLMEQIKKFRKGQKDALNFLDEPGGVPRSGPKEPKKGPVSTRKSRTKRMAKDMKYGFGGQKKRQKYNTKDSADDVGSFVRLPSGKVTQRRGSGGGKNFRGAVGNPGSRSKFKTGNKNRPGKARRQQMKTKSKR